MHSSGVKESWSSTEDWFARQTSWIKHKKEILVESFSIIKVPRWKFQTTLKPWVQLKYVLGVGYQKVDDMG